MGQWAATPWSGIRAIERTDPGPVRVRAFEVDLCDPGMTVRASTPAEANQTVSSWASRVDVQAAVNANMWHCGALCGVGIGNGERFAAADDGHWGYISFSPEQAEYPWDYDTIPPPIWVEQAVGGHPRIVNGGAPIPEFAGNCLERHPRTAAGFSTDRTKLIMAVVDGRSSTSVGMTCAQLAGLMVSLGAHDALNLDGGGSSTAWRADRGVLNRPSDGSQRVVRNHLGVRSYGEGAPRYCSTHRALTADDGVMRLLSQPVSEAFGFSLLDLRAWPGEYIAAYERGPDVELPRLVRQAGTPAIFLVDGGFRRHIRNPNALRGFHLHDNSVEELSASELEAFPEGPALTQYPYIAVSPPPDRQAFLVDYRLPELPTSLPPGDDAGPGGDVDAAAGGDAGVGGDHDAAAPGDAGARRDASVAADPRPIDPITGGCSTSLRPSAQRAWWALVLVVVAVGTRRRC